MTRGGGAKRIPIAKPWINSREASAARRAILSGWISQGPEVAAFEREFALAVGAKYACAVSNCTCALHLALLTAGLGPGDEVITVSHSFVASVNCIRYTGATPVLVDIEPETFNINPGLIERAISKRTKAILCVHQMGMPCDLTAILKLASCRSLLVIEDAACATGSEILWNGRWEKIGRPHGDIACFSFHPRKVITTGEGGMITTSRGDWDKRLRLFRQHGMSLSDSKRHKSQRVLFESYPTLGYNYRMTDIQAAIGRQQLGRLPRILERRRFLAARYIKLLSEIPGIGLPQERSWAKSNWQSFCVRLPAGLTQRGVMQELLDEGIAARRGIMCIHREKVRADLKIVATLKESELAQDRAILLPLYHQMTRNDQDRVVAALKRSCSKRIGGR